jgi:HAD superfamily hydrolase (TIGR01549 family)
MNSNFDQRRFNYVIFDLGNTLFYFQGSTYDALKEGYQAVARTLSTMGHISNEQTFLQRFNIHMEAYMREREATYIERTSFIILRRTLQEITPHEVPIPDLRTALNALYQISQQHWEIEEDTIACLDTLKSEGYHLGIISNAADAQDAQYLITKGKIGDYFDQVIISAEFGLRKPHPKIFQKALSYWKARPEEAVMIGDTLDADILGAQKIKMPAVWITRRAEKVEFRQQGAVIEPDASIVALDELPELLRNWC